MEMNACGKVIRGVVLILNFIVFVGAIIILAMGIYTLVDRPYLENLIGANIYSSAAYILITVGCFTLIVSFFGCLGALKEIKCLLMIYFIIVFLLFVVLLIGGILGYVFRSKAEVTVMNSMTAAMKAYVPGSMEPMTKAWDETQLAMQCCGIKLPLEDWVKNNKNYNTDNKTVPKSCCKADTDGKRMKCQSNPTEDNAFMTGCYDKSTVFIKANSLMIGGTGVAVAIVMLIGIVFSLTLFLLIK